MSTSLDDELALFESEMSSLITDTPSSHESVDSLPSSNGAAPRTTQPIAQNDRSVARPPAAFIATPTMLTPMSLLVTPVGVLPPTSFFNPPVVGVPAPSLRNIFVPHQIRAMAPVTAPRAAPVASATISSAPELYENNKEVILQTQALPADVIAIEEKRRHDEIVQMAERSNRGNKKKKYFRAGGGQVWEDSSLADWDPNDYRVFCGDLGNEVSDELLAKAFRKYHSFQRAKVIRDGRTNKSKGYGFVSFRDTEDYARAMREMDGKYVGNRPIKLRKSNWKDRNLDVVKRKQKEKTKLGLWG